MSISENFYLIILLDFYSVDIEFMNLTPMNLGEKVSYLIIIVTDSETHSA